MIKSLSYNDLLALVIEFQIDDINQYLSSKNGGKPQEEVIEANPYQATMFLCGGIPKAKRGEIDG